MPSLKEYFINDSFRHQLESGDSICGAFSDLMKYFWKNEENQHCTSPLKVNSNAILSKFKFIYLNFLIFKKKIGALCSRFQGFNQQDSHEFLLYLLDGMHEELKLKTEKLTSFREIVIKSPKDDDEQKEAYLVNYWVLFLGLVELYHFKT